MFIQLTMMNLKLSQTPAELHMWNCCVEPLSACPSLQFCEVITVYWLKDLSGQVVRVLLDYMDHVNLCSKLKAAVMEQPQWPDICRLQGEVNQTCSIPSPDSDSCDNRAVFINLFSPCHPPQRTPALCSISAVCGSVNVLVAFVCDLLSS